MNIVTSIQTWLQGKKTYLLSAIGFATSAVAFIDHWATWLAAFVGALASCGLATIRAAIAKAGG